MKVTFTEPYNYVDPIYGKGQRIDIVGEPMFYLVCTQQSPWVLTMETSPALNYWRFAGWWLAAVSDKLQELN